MADPRTKDTATKPTFLTLSLEIRQKILLASEDHIKMPDFHLTHRNIPPLITNTPRYICYLKHHRELYFRRKKDELRTYKENIEVWVASLKEIAEIKGDIEWVEKMWLKGVKSVLDEWRGVL